MNDVHAKQTALIQILCAGQENPEDIHRQLLKIYDDETTDNSNSCSAVSK
jgi:hypothetical protein